jgi:hypothetical protein
MKINTGSESRRVFVGIDEAGYGPNLGPLVVARSVWQVASSRLDATQFATLLSSTFKPLPWSTDCKHIPLGDSKQLYQASGSLRSLEAGLLSMLSQLPGLAFSQLPRNFHQLSAVCGKPTQISTAWASPGWYDESALQALHVPEYVDNRWFQELCRLSALAGAALEEFGIELLDLQAVVVREAELNASLEQYGSKGKVLGDTTLRLIVDAAQRWSDCELHFYCDRQGGRKDYLPLLLQHMPDEWFQEITVSATRSSYLRQREPEFQVHFSVRGDTFPPTGLASMLAKYFRQRHMQAFNAFWQQHLPSLRPTAGYPTDAQRVRKEIMATAQALGLDEATWWRRK